MQWKKGEASFYEDIEWRPWFAILPVNDGIDWIWLEWVDTRRKHRMSPYGPFPLTGWEYRKQKESEK